LRYLAIHFAIIVAHGEIDFAIGEQLMQLRDAFGESLATAP
jgi:flagellar biosynthesis/type III secretory pathway protein FliH